MRSCSTAGLVFSHNANVRSGSNNALILDVGEHGPPPSLGVGHGNSSCSSASRALEQGRADWPKVAAQTERCLGHPDQTSAWPQGPRSRPIQSGDRLEAPRLRLGEAPVSDVSHAGQMSSRAMVMQQKTGRPVQFEITQSTREAVQAWITLTCPHRTYQ